MISYYSNLIEGQHTHPVDIERAMRDEYSSDTHKRDLQLGAEGCLAVSMTGPAGKATVLCRVNLISTKFR